MEARLMSPTRRFGAHGRIMFVITIISCSSGCLSMLGISHSSLQPRTASLDAPPTATVRSQNAPLADAAIDAEPKQSSIASGHSLANGTKITEVVTSKIPTAVLRPPQFHGSVPGGHSTGVEAPSTLINAVPQAANTPSPTNQDGHATQAAADQIRRLMNQTSSNDMSEGRVLDEKEQRWHIFSGDETHKATAVPPPAFEPAQSRPEEPSVEQSSSQANVMTIGKSREVSPNEQSTSELSMLEKLRGMYSGSDDETPRSRWRLPSPWSVFRDRDDESEQQPQTEENAVSNVLDDNEPADTQSSAVNPLLIKLIAALNAELQSWPQQPNGAPSDQAQFIRRQQDLRLLYLIADQPGAALTSIVTLPAAEQEFWQELMLGVAQYRATETDSPREQRLTNTAGQLRSAVRRLTPLTSLRINRIDVCSQIFSFGRIETFSSNTFDPGNPILLYVEVENFSTRITSGGNYETNFDAQLQFYANGNDEPIETVDLPGITDESSSERFDYFQSFELNIPSHLDAGRYRIDVKLWDRNSSRATKGSVEIRIREKSLTDSSTY